MPDRPQRRKQKQRKKRVQILDGDGWTHVATTTKKTPGSRASPQLHAIPDALRPAEAPDGLTFENLRDKFESHKLRWETSPTWDAVKRAMESELTRSNNHGRRLENCVCIGLGSPSGLLRGGLVDRRSISLFQLAALVTILDYISQSETLPTISKCYAQDPVFNPQDEQLLNHLGFEVVQHPDAFSLVTEHTFLYSPGAERTYLVQLLSKDPALFFGGPLDNGPARIDERLDENTLEEFAEARHSILLPEFEHNPNAFWKTRLYWRADGA